MGTEENSVKKYKHLFIWKQVVYGLLLVFVALMISFIVARQRGQSHIINLAARQGMLSQRMAKNTLVILQSDQENEIKERIELLRYDLNKLKKVHLGLQIGDEELNLPYIVKSEEIKKLFDQIFFYYHKFTGSVEHLIEYIEKNSYSTEKTPVLYAYSEIILQNEAEYLELMDRIAEQFDREAREKITYIQVASISALALLVIVLLTGLRYIYFPGFRFLNKTLKERKVSEEKYKRLFEFMPELVMISREGVILYMNPAGMKLVGAVDENQIIGRRISDFLDENDTLKYLERIAGLETKESHTPFEYTVYRLDGTTVQAGAVSTYIEDEEGRALLTAARDISERKKAEKLNATLFNISKAVNSTETIDELYRTVHSIIGDLFEADNFYIAYYDPANDIITFRITQIRRMVILLSTVVPIQIHLRQRCCSKNKPSFTPEKN